MEQFKSRLRELREEAGLSMKQLAAAVGVSDAAVCKWENGNAEPKVNYLIKLSNVFECTVDYLVGTANDYGSASYERTALPVKLTNKEKQLIIAYRELSPKLQGLIEQTIMAWKTIDGDNE